MDRGAWTNSVLGFVGNRLIERAPHQPGRAEVSKRDHLFPSEVNSDESRTIGLIEMTHHCVSNLLLQRPEIISLREDRCSNRAGGQPTLMSLFYEKNQLGHSTFSICLASIRGAPQWRRRSKDTITPQNVQSAASILARIRPPGLHEARCGLAHAGGSLPGCRTAHRLPLILQLSHTLRPLHAPVRSKSRRQPAADR
jgi:hypothetical protein